MRYCESCGTLVTTDYCTVCGTQSAGGAAAEASTATAAESGVDVTVQPDGTRTSQSQSNARPEPPAASVSVTSPDGFFRTPLQVLILGYASFGFYGVYWLIRGRRIAENRLDLERTSYWYYLFWLIPIVAIFSGCKSASIIENRIAVSGTARPVIPFWAIAFLYFVVDALWKLPDPYWLISVFSPVYIATMSVSLGRAERTDYPALSWPRLTACEWVILLLGGLVLVLGLIVSAMDVPAATRQFVMWVSAGIVVTICVFAMIKDE